MQDWDVECADASRINEFCNIYENEDLRVETKSGIDADNYSSCDAFKFWSGQF